MTWTDPTTVSTGDRFTAARRAKEWRDNLRFLYEPPHARATNPNATSMTGLSFNVLDFPKTLFDNGEIHGAADGFTLQQEPASGIMTANVAGKWLAHAIIDFEASTLAMQEVRGCVRGVNPFTGGFLTVGWKSSGVEGSGGPRTVPPVEWGYTLAVGDQMAVIAYASNDDGTKLISEFNRFPYFYVHWIGGP